MASPGFKRRHRLPRGVESLALRGPLRRHRLVTVNYLAYASGPAAASMATNRWIVLVTSVVMIGLLMFVARLGLRVGKWVTNAGSFLTVLIIALLALMPFIHRWRGSLSGYRPLHLVTPPLTLFSLSVFS